VDFAMLAPDFNLRAGCRFLFRITIDMVGNYPPYWRDTL